MPEGDTIRRIATTLAPRLTGKVLERVTTQGLPRDVAGQRVTGVHAHGKHLVIDLESGAYLRAHLGMNGRVRIYDRARGDAILARMSPGRASLALVTDDGVYVWVSAPTIEVSHRRKPLHGTAVASLGPDILAADFDAAAAAARAAEHGARMIGEVVMDQGIVAGIGNIYKTESLFDAAVDPRTRVAQIDAATIERIYAAAHRLMLANAEPSRGQSPMLPPRNAAPFAVYGRTGRPCPRCGAAIACYPLGQPPRWTWSCPSCQRQTDGTPSL